jgi:hypothetical protein
MLTADTAQFTMGLREASGALASFEGKTKQYADGIARGMSSAGRAASDSGKMIAGMSASGREALAQSEEAFNQTAQAGNRAGQALTAVAGIIGTINIGAKAAEAAAATSRIQDAAERLKIGTEAVQRLSFAAEQSGGSLEGVATAMGRMAETLGSKGADERLKAIGLSLEQIKGLSPDQTFVTIAEAIRQIPDPLRQSDEATNLFGRSALALLPAIRAGFKEVGDQAPVMSDAVIESGDRVGDKLHEIELRMNNLKAQALLPLVDFFTTNLPQSVQVGIAGIASFVPSLETLTLSILALGGPSGAWSALLAMGSTVVAFFTTTLPAAFGAVLAFLGPQGIIALAILALVGVWYLFGDQIKAFLAPLTEWVVAQFTALKEKVTAVWTGIADTVVSWFSTIGGILRRVGPELLLPLLGPIGAVLLAFQKWPEIVAIVQKVYTGVKTWMVDKLNEVWASLKGKIDAVKGYFSDLYTAVVGNSYIPDMVAGIGTSIAQLDNVFVKPSQLANELVGNAFKAMTKVATDALSDLIGKVTGTFSDITTKVMPSFGSSGASTMSSIGKGFKENFLSAFGAGLGEGLVNLAGEGLKALWNHVRGGEEAQIVNPARDAFFAKFGGYEGLAKALTAASDGNIADQLIKVLYNADTKAAFEAAVQAIEDVLNGGGAAGGRSPAEVSLDNLGLSVTTTDAALQALSATWTGIAAAMAQGLTDATAQFDLVVASVERLNAAVLVAMQDTWAIVSEGVLAGLIAITEAFTPLIAHLDVLTLDKLPDLRRTFNALEDALLQSLAALTNAFDPLIGQVDRFIAALNAVPREIVVQMRVEQSEVPAPSVPEPSSSEFGGGGQGFWEGPDGNWSDVQPRIGSPPDLSGLGLPPHGDVFQPQDHILSFAKEGIVSTPTFAIVGDAMEPEWILHQSSVVDMARRAFSMGAMQADTMADVASLPTGSNAGRSGGDVFKFTAQVTVNGTGKDGASIADQIARDLPQAMRRDHSLVVKMRKAVTGKAAA